MECGGRRDLPVCPRCVAVMASGARDKNVRPIPEPKTWLPSGTSLDCPNTARYHHRESQTHSLIYFKENIMNFIVIVSDTLRRDHLGCYGNDWISTPHIDRFASRAQVFDRAYSGSFPTVPHRRLFGKFPNRASPPGPIHRTLYRRLHSLGAAQSRRGRSCRGAQSGRLHHDDDM